MPEKIALLRESGETLNSNVVSIFMIPDTGKKYIITTENAVDPHGLTVLHVSEIHDSTLVKIEEDEDWSAIKTIMRAIISGNVGSYQYLALISKAKIDGQYSRDISVSSSAAKQMTDNYNAADKLDQAKIPKDDGTAADASANPVGGNASSIFPTNGVKPTEENEISPGISDMAVQVNPVASPQTVQAALPEDTNMTAAKPAMVVATDQVAAAAQPMAQPVQVVQQVPQTVQVVQQVQPASSPVVDATQMVAQSYGIDNGLNASISTMGVTAGYGTMAPMENQTVYGNAYQQPVNLEAIVAEVQEKFNESIRNLVYSVYDKVQNEATTRQIMQQTMQQPLQQMQQPLQQMQVQVQKVPSANYGYGVPQQVQQYPQQVQQVAYPQGYQQPVMNAYPQGMYQPMVVQASNDMQ